MQALPSMAEKVDELTGDLAALLPWGLRFAPDDALAELQFLYSDCRSLPSATATLILLEQLLSEPDQAPAMLQSIPAESTERALLLTLIDWRIARSRKKARPLSRIRTLLRRMETGDKPERMAGDVEPVIPDIAAPLVERVKEAFARAGDLSILITWLLPFVPEEDLRELEEIKKITCSYRLAAFAVCSLEALVAKSWRSPRPHVRGELSMVDVLIDYRIARGRGERSQLERIKKRVRATLRLEETAAARRQLMQEAFALAFEPPVDLGDHG